MITKPTSAFKYLFVLGGKAGSWRTPLKQLNKSLLCTLTRCVGHAVSEVDVASAWMVIFTSDL